MSLTPTEILQRLETLEREVIEAAKEDLQSEVRREGDHGIDRMIAARRAYRAAVLALIEFESSLHSPPSG